MEPSQQTQQGSGSAENKGEDHDAQRQPMEHRSNKQKQQTGEDIDEGNHDIADLGELGMSGTSDEQSGGSGDKMNEQSTGEKTNK
jgi:hypothetical protein